MKIVFTNSTNSGSIDTIDDTRYNISEGKEVDTTETDDEVVDDTSKQEEEDMGTEDTNKDMSKLSPEELEALRDGKAIKCPECGSTNINIHDNGESYFCTDCEYSWDVRDADDDGLDDDIDDYIDAMVEELDESYQFIGNTYTLEDGSSVYVISNEGSSFNVLDINSTDRYTIQESLLLNQIKEK
jgi:hypothetical protein|nr:MAG TPA: phnA-like protein [Bacteriophage sp.]